MLEEIVRHNADVVCLQEIDHFRFFRKSLAALGYTGHFTPKPDSPCLYLPDNAGPDGCAIFYKRDKFDLVQLDSRILEVWKVQSNQVILWIYAVQIFHVKTFFKEKYQQQNAIAFTEPFSFRLCFP